MTKFLLSVVIPVLNEEKYLPNCLDSIVCQKYNGPVNIIVSDNGCTDKTLKIAKKYNCYIAKGSKKGNVASARKVGYEKAKELAKTHKNLEEIVINVDADTTLSKNYFAEVAEVFKNKSIVTASGPFIINHRQIPIKKFNKTVVKLHYLACFLELRFPWMLKKIWNNTFMYGSNSCIRRSVYEEIGGYDERFEKAEDLAISLELLKKDYPITYADGLAAETSLRKFVNQKGNLDLKSLINYCFKDQKVRRGLKLAKSLFK